jgi:hypothetical protein
MSGVPSPPPPPIMHDFYSFWGRGVGFWFFKTGFLCVALAVLELTLKTTPGLFFFFFFLNLVILVFKERVLQGHVKETHPWIFFPCVGIFPLSSVRGR